MATPLRFAGAYTPLPGGVVPLRFGAGSGGPVTPPVTTTALRAACGLAWSAAQAVADTTAAPWGADSALVSSAAVPWGSAQGVAAANGTGWAGQQQRAASLRAPWGSNAGTAASLQAPWGSNGGTAGSVQMAWGLALRTSSTTLAPWQAGRAVSRSLAGAWHVGLPAGRVLLAPWGQGVRALPVWLAPWGPGGGVESIGGPWAGPETPAPAPGCYVPARGSRVALRFWQSWVHNLHLLFACNHGATIVVPPREVYYVINDALLKRVSDGVEIEALGMSLSLDYRSWCWGFSATCRASVLPLIEPAVAGEPIELEAIINGTAVRVLVESISRDRTFNNETIRITGRGKTAVLDAPYQPVTVFGNAGSALTTQQLLDQALPSGWTANYGLVPWLVPAGLWSHQGTPISAALAIAEAGGGYLQPDGVVDQVHVLPLYPLAPWDWAGATPDLQLPAELMQREAIEWADKPLYNRVFVSGTVAGGVLGRVTRAGSAGDLVAQMITDPLISHVDGVRQRGLPVLADVGRQAMVSLRAFVLPATGFVRPGMLVRYVDGGTVRTGLARALTVDVAGAEVWQTIRVETHVL